MTDHVVSVKMRMNHSNKLLVSVEHLRILFAKKLLLLASSTIIKIVGAIRFEALLYRYLIKSARTTIDGIERKVTLLRYLFNMIVKKIIIP